MAQAKRPAKRVKKASPRAKNGPHRGARDDILREARSLFYRRGLGTGLEEILRKAGASKPTFYHHFKGKESLEAQVLMLQAEELWESIDRLAVRCKNPEQLVRRWMDYVRRRVRANDMAGCPLGNFAIQCDRNHRKTVRDVFDRSTGKLADSLIAVGMQARRAAQIAPNLFTIYEGAHLMVRATGDDSHYRRATDLMVTLIQ